MIYNNIIINNKNETCYLTINRPKQLNALNGETILELHKAIEAADNNKLIRLN